MAAPVFPADLAAVLRAAAPGAAVAPMAGGRTNRLFRAGDLVVKLYVPGAESPLFPNDAGAEAGALSLLAPLGLAPVMLARGAGWLVYRHLPGAAWAQGPAGPALALGRLHGMALAVPGFRAAPSGSAALLAQARAIAGGDPGPLPPAPEDPGLAPLARPVLIHGDAVSGNMIDQAGRVMLIDWQCPALGEPAEDLAAFLSPAMQYLYRGRPLSAAERTAFLAACPDRAIRERYLALAPVLHWRLAAHCLWRLRRGDADYGPALALELAALAEMAA